MQSPMFCIYSFWFGGEEIPPILGWILFEKTSAPLPFIQYFCINLFALLVISPKQMLSPNSPIALSQIVNKQSIVKEIAGFKEWFLL